jgi:glycosidase
MMKRLFLATLSAFFLAGPVVAQDYLARLPEDEVIYFLLPDRFENGDTANDKGGLKGGRLVTGFDPTAKGYYHGGDIKGLIKRLGYIQGLGATALWVAPIFKNQPVRGAPGDESAGYHGYWVTDFTTVDPHFGSEADFKALVDAAHARGMKVYMDIITNHTADIIRYRECPNGCEYRSRADYPYQRRASDGAAINPGFAGDSVHTAENFAKLIDPNFAYTPFIPKGMEHAKKPEWLNDVTLYHNRGNSTFSGENSTMGDFVDLDDPMTENPRVVQGFIEIYTAWIEKYAVDGFRVDTAKHVNPEFWQKFVPAILAKAKARGIPNFHVFGEIGGIGLEPGKLAVHTRVDGFPSVLDFAFHQAVVDTVAGTSGTDHLDELFAGDPLYEGGAATARQLPTWVSNHDNGRIGWFVRKAFPDASDDEVLKRVRLAHAMMLTLRGVPTVYAGDEQGFAGDGWDQDAREDMFASKTAVYNDNKLIGTANTTAQSNFGTTHPLYAFIAELAALRGKTPALRRGVQAVHNYGEKPGLFAVSRTDAATGQEVSILFNTSATPLTANAEVSQTSNRFTSLYGTCPATARAPGSIAVTLAPFDFMICETIRK